MDVNVTIKVGSEGLKELAAVIVEMMGNPGATQGREVGNVAAQLETNATAIPSTTVTQQTQSAPVAPVPTTQTAPAAQPVPTTQQSYTLDDLSLAAMQLMDKGLQTKLQDLLSGYGVSSLPELPQTQYGNFATALRGMGAQI